MSNVPEQRVPAYLSPSALKVFEESKQDYFVQYLSPIRMPRPPQEDYMAIGGAFDTLVKRELGWKGDWKPDEVRNYDADDVRARAAGLFRQYKACGALGRLVGNVAEVLWMEDSIQSHVYDSTGAATPMALLGKPDLVFRDPLGRVVVLDWKVNGSAASTVPAAASGWKHGHRLDGLPIERGRAKPWTGLIHEQWADQLATYQLLIASKQHFWADAAGEGADSFVPGPASAVHCRIEQLRCTRGGLDSVMVHEGQPGLLGNTPSGSIRAYDMLLARYAACWQYAVHDSVADAADALALVAAFAPSPEDTPGQAAMKKFMWENAG